MKKVLGLAILGAGVVAAVTAVRRKMSHDRAEEDRFLRDLERFEGEGGQPATL